MEEDQPEEYTKKHERRKANTDANNAIFLQSLKTRMAEGAPDFKLKNVQRVHSMNSGRPLVKRLDIPDGVDVF